MAGLKDALVPTKGAVNGTADADAKCKQVAVTLMDFSKRIEAATAKLNLIGDITLPSDFIRQAEAAIDSSASPQMKKALKAAADYAWKAHTDFGHALMKYDTVNSQNEYKVHASKK